MRFAQTFVDLYLRVEKDCDATLNLAKMVMTWP